MKNNKIIWVVVVLLLALFGYYLYTKDVAVAPVTPVVETPVSTSTDTTNGNSTNTPATDATFITYKNTANKYSISYPSGYKVNEKYTYSAMGPAKTISGTSFTIPASLAAGTNLSKDSYISVEHFASTKPCSVTFFTMSPASTSTVRENGITYSVSHNTEAAAGNRYDETVYVLPGTGNCIAVRYFIHYGVYENYPKGSITAFNQKSLVATFDAVRKSLTVTK
jgi:hypothetical protein